MLKKILIAFAALLAIVMAVIFIFAEDFELTLSEAQVQSAIDAKLAEGDITHLGVTLIPVSANIDFTADNRAVITMNFDAEGFGQSGSLSGELSSGLRYNAPRLYLGDVDAQNLRLIPTGESAQTSSDLKNVATDFFKRKRDEMLSKEAQDSLDRLVGVEGERVADLGRKAMESFFGTVPIYDLNRAGYKGSLASLALKDVRFTADSAIVTLSPRQAVIKILSILGVLLLLCVSFAAYLGLHMGPEKTLDLLTEKHEDN